MIISTKKGTPQVELDRIVDNFEKQGLSVTFDPWHGLQRLWPCR